MEDEEDHAWHIKQSLGKANVLNPIVWVKNGVEAIEYITKTGRYEQETPPTPGLILLDIKMPLMDGFEVLKKIKMNEKYQTIPVVILTTTSLSEDIKKAMQLGANDFIVKPVKFSDFTDKVKLLGYYWAFVSDANRRD
ncbi:MAG: response regulator [bacterium]|nr:response regulator [bacterium]